VSIAKGARAETGATAVRIADGRLVVGYAMGNTPRASVLDPAAGTATAVDVEGDTFAAEAKALEKGSALTILRVTPFAAKELKMRVIVDTATTLADKTKRARCGFADAEPLVSTGSAGANSADGGGAGTNGDQVNSCRSFTDGKKTWILSSWGKAAGEGAKAESRWVVNTVAEDGASAEAALGTRTVPDPRQDRYGFELPASAHDGDAGYVFASRFNGNLAIARKGEGSDITGELSLSWFGAAAGMPAVALADRTVTIIAPLSGKPDLYGASFPIEAKVPPKPTLLDVSSEGAGERTSLSILRAGADTVLGFVEAKGEAKHAKVAILDAALKPRLPVFELPGHDKVAMLKLVPLERERTLVLTLDGGELAASTLECPQ